MRSPEFEEIIDTLKAMKFKHITAHVLNAANFARIGEKPFLHSYKQKLRRFVDQVDLQDATFSGKNTPLARGNAEVKEMVSILRCANFGGTFMLRAHLPAEESLVAAADRFLGLLNSM